MNEQQQHSTHSVGHPSLDMQDETHRQDNGVQAEQQPGQYASGGSVANAAHSASQPGAAVGGA